MTAADDRVTCRTPKTGGQPTRILRWKFDAMRDAILASVSTEEEGTPFRELRAGISAALDRSLDANRRAEFGSVGWYLMTVKLELEVRGEIERVPGASPQRLRRVG